MNDAPDSAKPGSWIWFDLSLILTMLALPGLIGALLSGRDRATVAFLLVVSCGQAFWLGARLLRGSTWREYFSHVAEKEP